MEERNEVEKIMKERIKENEKLFNKNDLKIINNNINIMKKIYLMGLINGREIWKKLQ